MQIARFVRSVTIICRFKRMDMDLQQRIRPLYGKTTLH
jgi:hypothetical protein